jgi:GT2 family glycosyltransferase
MQTEHVLAKKMKTETVYILLPVHNRRHQTKEFIKCLKIQTYQNYQLILIDDGSTDGTAEMVQAIIPSTTVLKGHGKWWWAGALQQGINWLKHNPVNSNDLILMINDDVMFGPEFLNTAIDLLHGKQGILLQAQSYSKRTGCLATAGVSADLKNLSFRKTTLSDEINCLSTMGLFLRFADLSIIGDFYPKLLPHYLSDCEFTIRAYKKGLKLITDSKLILYFDEETSGFNFDFKNQRISDIRKYFSTKSVVNPIYWTNFVILTCPKVWIPINIVRIWRSALLFIYRSYINELYHLFCRSK